MSRRLLVLALTLVCAGSVRAQGVLIPSDADLAPLRMRSHEVNVTLHDQAAVTKVVQTFLNDSDRQLEATYIFPVPKGASVRKFSMWVGGKEVPGELVEADKARQIYTDIVRRTQDPGLLEYVGNNLLRVRVFPVPARGEQKLAVSFTSVANSDQGLVEYVYPLRADSKGARTLEKFTLEADLKAQHPLQSIYSPTHPITVTRVNDRHARVRYEGHGIALDKDFQLYYTSASKDVGLTALLHRPERSGDGHFMLLISPRAELSKSQQIPRDMVFVLDTSGSMQGRRIEQARSALKYCLKNLGAKDRFALIQFATTVNKYQDSLLPATSHQLSKAQKWVDGLEATGSTNINDALLAALEMRTSDSGRCFTVVFFTDGQPTISETNPEQIVRNMMAKNTSSTRIFTFGVGDDVNAVLLDQLAEKTRSVCTYVRETEDIEAKVSGLYAKISHPVLTDLKLTVASGVTVSEVYPPQLPDLFHGSQLVVLGRYHGHGHAPITLSGKVGTTSKDFVYEVAFPRKTTGDKAFVEDLWARRKVGYLLDQIRTAGTNKELVDEVVRLAKKHGITTPYTSYLVAPDQATPVAQQPSRVVPPQVVTPQNGTPAYNFYVGVGPESPAAPPGAAPMSAAPATTAVPGVVDRNGSIGSSTASGTYLRSPPPQLPAPGYSFESHGYASAPVVISNTAVAPCVSAPAGGSGRVQFAPVTVNPSMQWAVPNGALAGAPETRPSTRKPYFLESSNDAEKNADEEEEEEEEEKAKDSPAVDSQSGKHGVDLAVRLSEMRTQSQVGQAKVRQAAGRSLLKVRGVWVDDGCDPKMPTVKVKAQGAAYFRILERHAQMREVFRLGNRIAWVTPNGTVLVVDPSAGAEQMTDEAIDTLFEARP
jgi:Ca-activated chloride channel family protein